LQFISRPAVTLSKTRAEAGGWVASAYQGGSGHQANPASIHVVREKVQGERALVALEYEDTEGRHWSYVYGAHLQNDGNWKASGGWGGSDTGHPQRPLPWVNLGGSGNDSSFCAGGRVHGEGVDRVRLTSPDGRTIEDQIQNGVALLLGDAPFGVPYTVELLDHSGNVIGTHAWGHRPPT